MQLRRVFMKTLKISRFVITLFWDLKSINSLSVPLVDGLDVSENHPLFATFQILWHRNITVWVSNFGDVAERHKRLATVKVTWPFSFLPVDNQR